MSCQCFILCAQLLIPKGQTVKPIKFDLKLADGTKLATLDNLEENLTPELLEHFYSGKLAKWLRVRKLNELADALDALLVAENEAKHEQDVQLFKKFCEIFVSEVDEEDAREAMESYTKSESSDSNDEEIEQLKAENEALRTEIEQLKVSMSKNMDVVSSTDEKENVDEQLPSNAKSDDECVQLLENGDETQRAEIASQPNLSVELQKLLSKDASETVLIALANNVSLNDEVQAELVNLGLPEIREAIASNPSLSEEQQTYLAKTASNDVKYKLAENPSLILSIQTLFANHSEWRIRWYLAENPSLDVSCIAILIKDDDTDVRNALAKNPLLPPDLQVQIANNEEDKVIKGLALNPALSEELMEKLANSSNGEIKKFLAKNESLPEFLQAHLIANSSGEVIENLALNPSLKIAQQAELLGKSDNIRLNLFDNASLHEPFKAKIIASFNQSDLEWAKSSSDHDNKQANEKFKEHTIAWKKNLDYGYSGGIFWSQSTKDELEAKEEYAKERYDDAEQKARNSLEKLKRIEHIISLQSA